MTASSSQVSLSNRALAAIGGRSTISSLTEGSVEANAISILFQPTFEQLARTAQWNCLRQQASLTVLAAAKGTPENPTGTGAIPPVPWLYSYALPNDCLDVRYILPPLTAVAGSAIPATSYDNFAPTYIPNTGQIDFAVSYSTDSGGNPIQIILTNQENAIAVYTVNQPNPIIWDSLFEQAFVASLAAFLVPTLTLQMELMQIQIKVAEQAIQIARVRDGDEGATTQDHVPDWIRARQTGSYYSFNLSNSAYNYNNMIWPAY